MAKENIAIDLTLRELLLDLQSRLSNGQPPKDEVLVNDEGAKIIIDTSRQLTVERNFAGFRWRLEVNADDLEALTTGQIREWPMTRLGKATEKMALSNDAINRILGSLGFDEEEAPPSAAQATKATEKPKRALSGLEDDLDADADFGSVSESDLDAFLNAYADASSEPQPGKPEPAEETQDDLAIALFEDLLAGGLGEEEESDEDALQESPQALESAVGFLEVLVKNEKLELTGSDDIEIIAAGLAPFLDEETSPDKRAPELIDWLLDQDGVEDIFASDEEMAALLRMW